METKESKSQVINKPAPQTRTSGKSELVKDEKASLIKPSRLPSFMQRKAVAVSEEEKEKKLLAIQSLKSQQQQLSGYKNIELR